MRNAHVYNDAGELQCSTCNRFLPATAEFFVINKACRGGIAGRCRKCHRAYYRKWSNTDAHRAQRRRYYELREKPRTAEKARLRMLTQPFHERASILRDGMKERAKWLGIPFDRDVLTVQFLKSWLQRQRTCECCGCELDVARKMNGQKNNHSPSIDRIIPALGYVVGNVALLCWRCNNLKRDATADELQRVADWLRSRTRPRLVLGDQAPPLEAQEAAP